MKPSKSDVHRKCHKLPEIRFEQQSLTSFAGLVIFQELFARINLKAQLRECFGHLQQGKIFGHTSIFFQLVVHILLGFRDLRDSCFYRFDPLVKRVLGLNQLPDVATISRTLKDADDHSVQKLRHLLRKMVLDRIKKLHLPRITIDFDGSVLSTGRCAQGTAVGFNKKKKGLRSYYPLFATIAQLGQVLDLHHRPGNVHDSNGAREFILACVQAIRQVLPQVQIEVRMDSAFFSDAIVEMLDQERVEFTITVPFERFPLLKQKIEQRQRWYCLNDEVCYFESSWKPQSWSRRFRFAFVRTRVKKQRKGPVQLDLFIPYEYGYDFKVIVTNKTVQMHSVVAYHDGRGSQEGLFAELKSQCHMDYVPVRTRVGNQIYLLAVLIAHNLTRELQMQKKPPDRGRTAKRAALWVFEQVDTLRHQWVQRAGRLTWPKGKLTLTISGNRQLKTEFLAYLGGLQRS